MNPNDLLNKIDWTNLLIKVFPPTMGLGKDCKFDNSPREFLKYAQQNYIDGDKQGLVDALSNAKRAIDCQIDCIISFFGYSYDEFTNRNCYPSIENIIEEYQERNEPFNGIPVRLEFIQALNIAPSFLVSKIRKLRNKLEHEYIMPTKEEVKEAVEIAELFINSTDNVVFHNMYPEFCFGSDYDEKTYYRDDDSSYKIMEFNSYFFEIDINTPNKKCKIKCITNSNAKLTEITPEDKGYIYLIRASMGDFKYLPKVFGVEMNLQDVNYVIRNM